ncbi:MAG: peptidoglycan D,D-transpeptidase FtsI family protein [Actinomycetota bacterium]
MAACLILASCTSSKPPTIASLQVTADSFISAWNQRDAKAMVKSFDPDTTRGRTPARLSRFFHQTLLTGAIKSFEVTRSGDVAQPSFAPGATPSSGIEAAVPITITYHSTAMTRPARLSGTVPFVYHAESDRWSIIWKRSLMWPGVPRAAGFDISYKWLRRGAILDRHGSVLAHRSGADRSYPQGALAGDAIGYVGSLPIADAGPGRPVVCHLTCVRGDPGDYVGNAGLEAGLDDTLAGAPTTKLAIVDKKGKSLQVIGHKKGHPGRSVKTTLDIGVQRATEAGLGSTVGAAVVLDPKNGDILALATSDPLDPNSYVGAAGVTPFDRSRVGLYPPGSSMKVVTASAALDTKTVTPTDRFPGPYDYRGVHNFHHEHFADISFADALKFSVNTVFAQVAEKVGAAKLYHYGKLFGFNVKSDLPLSVETSSFPRPQDDADLMFSAIGQAQVVATPLQMATVAATVANGGRRMDPRITMSTKPKGHRVMKASTAKTMTTLMEGVVQGGTGTAANIAGADVAGKTGTAEVDVGGQRKNHAWFICFAPGGAPKIAVAVVAEYGGVGGEVAAPIARRILEGALPIAP